MLQALSRFSRLLYINLVLIKHGLDDIVLATHLYRPLRILKILLKPTHIMRVDSKAPRGVRLRKALVELGTMFVKFGQLLSTRLDILPEDIAVELVKLQDQVPPFPGEQAKAIVEKELGKPIDELFAEFDCTPLASASIAQVHAAKLLDGREVAIKVLRPDIEKIIQRDLQLIKIIAKLADRYWSKAKQFKPLQIYEEIANTIEAELDMTRDAANCSQLRRNFLHSHLLYIPEVHWSHTTKRVLVMERIYGIQVSNITELKKRGFDLKLLAERGVEIFFTQVFRDCFFHADMHPGNIWIAEDDPKNPQYLGVDFGIMGTLGPDDQRYLAENVLAFFKRDYRRVAELHVESGWVPPNTRVDEFESAIRSVCEPIFERPLKEISFGQTLMRLFQTAKRFDMEIQPQLLLLQKTLFSVEGLGRQLYPDLDLWNTAKPFLEEWMAKRMGPKALVAKIKRQGPGWLEKLPEMPNMLHKTMQSLAKLEQAQALFQAPQPFMKRATSSLLYHLSLGILATIIIFAGIQNFRPVWLQLFNQHANKILLGSASLGFIMVWLKKWRFN